MPEYIDREALIDRIELRERKMLGDKEPRLVSFKPFILNEPVVDVAPIAHGVWIYDHATGEPFCSECGRDAINGEITPFCPHCGAKMEEDENG